MKKFNSEELEYLKNNYKFKTAKELANYFNCDSTKIYREIKKLKLFKNNKNAHFWDENKLNWLIENYPVLGLNKCSDFLKMNIDIVKTKKDMLKLKMNNKFKGVQNDKCNINPELFYNIKTNEIVYLLGLIWADGFLNASKNGYNHNLGFTMVKEDFDIIKPSLEKIGRWNYYERKQNVDTWKPSINIITNNKRIYNFLVDNDYDKKSKVSADKILNKIPNELKHYFFRGLIDGDGCFYYNEKNNSKQFVLTSTYEQDWGYFESLCNRLEIKYKIKRIINKKSSYSIVRITNKSGINKLGSYIYNNFECDKIGLTRKYDKFISIIK